MFGCRITQKRLTEPVDEWNMLGQVTFSEGNEGTRKIGTFEKYSDEVRLIKKRRNWFNLKI